MAKRLSSSQRLQPLVAYRAVRQLIRDPDDTAQVFRIIEALSGGTHRRIWRRFTKEPVGRQVLDENRELLPTLLDRDMLRSLPEGSLGRAYLDFLEAEGITSEGLVAASKTGYSGSYGGEDYEYRLVRNRLRDMHDLWHVTTGYQGDLVGEAALLAFSFAQTRNVAIAFIVAAIWLRGRSLGIGRQLRRGFVRGLRAEWLPGQDWEALLPLPLDEVRERLGVGEPVSYQPVRSWGRSGVGPAVGSAGGGNRSPVGVSTPASRL